MVIIRSLGSDGSQGVAMAAKSLSSVMKVSFNCYMGLEDKQNVAKMQDWFCYELQWPTLSGK
jgi:hypothetical protein